MSIDVEGCSAARRLQQLRRSTSAYGSMMQSVAPSRRAASASCGSRSVGVSAVAMHGFGCTVHAEPVVSAMDKEVLQLHGAAFVHAPFAQGGVERTVAFGQFGFHEYLPHDRVDERRVHAVSPEKPCARQVAAESFGVAAETVSDGEFHCLSCPASRPVENAIWRL